jgi:hypothetical protein
MSRRKGEAIPSKKERPAKRQKKEPAPVQRLADKARRYHDEEKYELVLEALKEHVEKHWHDEPDEPNPMDSDDWWMKLRVDDLGPKEPQLWEWLNDQGFLMVETDLSRDWATIIFYSEKAVEAWLKLYPKDRRVVESDWK